MTVLDAYAVIAYLRDEAAAEQVARLLGSGGANLTAVGLAEVFDQMAREAGADEEDLALDLAELGLLEAIPIEPAVGAGTGRLRARYYHRTRCAVSMADCVAAEAARALRRPLATSDPHLLDVCHSERIEVIVLPRSDGSTWQPPA